MLSEQIFDFDFQRKIPACLSITLGGSRMSRSLTRSPGRARRRTRSPGDAVSGWSTARPSPLQVELDSPPGHDKYSAYFYRPHFLTALFAAFAALTYVAFFTSGIDLVRVAHDPLPQ